MDLFLIFFITSRCALYLFFILIVLVMDIITMLANKAMSPPMGANGNELFLIKNNIPLKPNFNSKRIRMFLIPKRYIINISVPALELAPSHLFL